MPQIQYEDQVVQVPIQKQVPSNEGGWEVVAVVLIVVVPCQFEPLQGCLLFPIRVSKAYVPVPPIAVTTILSIRTLLLLWRCHLTGSVSQ